MKNYISVDRVASPILHATTVFTMFVFIAILVMSYLFKVEIVAKGTGKIVPLTRIQVVQSEFSGQIAAIHVKNGSDVIKNETLVELDETDAKITVNTLSAEVIRLQVEKSRISHILGMTKQMSFLDEDSLKATKIKFEKANKNGNIEYIIEQSSLLEAETLELINSLEKIETRNLENEESKNVTLANIARVDASLKTQSERLEIVSNLVDRGTASRVTYLDVFDDYTQLQNEREIYLKELDQKGSLENVFKAEKRSLFSALRNRLLSRRASINTQIFELSEQLVSSRRRLSSAKLIAPTNGTIDKLNVFTVGGVILAGEEIMRVVPKKSEFEVEAIFPNTDIGFLSVGLKTNIKLDAFPSERFGVIRGIITNVSADAIELSDGTGGFGFVVQIKPDNPFLRTATNKFPLRPGMTSTVDVITGNRRIISYFFAPILRTIKDSLGER